MSDASAGSSTEIRRTAERLIGTDLDGRYRVDELLGTGGMGAVFRGHHRFMDQAVAIKVLRPTLARDPSAAERFVREARGTFKVDSDHAVKVLDFAITEGGLLYMVLELLEGRTVGAELADDGAMAPRRAVRVARQACDALAAAHKVGLIHRDLKPDNIMLVRRAGDPDHAKVLDFGLAKVMEGAGEQALSMAALTQGGVVFGTPDYMAPEQALGQKLDARCDLYALGATLFEMIAGRPPFVASSPLEVLAAHVRERPPSLRAVAPGVDVPDALEALIAQCLAKSPDARPRSATELGAALRTIEQGMAGARRVPQAETLPVPAVLGSRETATVSLAARPAARAPVGEPARDDAAPLTGSAAYVPTDTAAYAPTESAAYVATDSAMYSTDELSLERRSRAPIVIVALALAAAAIVVIVAVTRSRDRDQPRGSDRAQPGLVQSGPGSATGAGSDPATGSGSEAGTGSGPGTGTGAGSDPGTGSGSEAGTGSGPGTGTGTGSASGSASAPGSGSGSGSDAAARRAAAAEALRVHLAAAEAARRNGNPLRQLAEADAALALAPRNGRARFLIGDALVTSGDLTKGCKYLRQARTAAAAARATGAGCPAAGP